MRKLLWLFAICGCGGSQVETNTGGSTTPNPFSGVYRGDAFIGGKLAGPARLGVQDDGWGVFSLPNKKGFNEDWLVKVQNDGKFKGQWWGNDFPDGDQLTGTLEFGVNKNVLTMGTSFKFRTVGTVVFSAKRE